MHIHICNMHVANVNMHVDMLSPVCGHTSIYLQYEWSLMINTMQDCVAKRFIQWQLGYKVLLDSCLTCAFLGESPDHSHCLLSVAPPHVPHVQSVQRATLSVPGFGLRDSAGVVSCNPVESGWGNTWIHWASE